MHCVSKVFKPGPLAPQLIAATEATAPATMLGFGYLNYHFEKGIRESQSQLIK